MENTFELKKIGGQNRPIRITYGVIFRTATDLKLKNLSELDKLSSSDITKFNDFLICLYFYGLKAGAKANSTNFTNSKEDVKDWLFDLDMTELTDLEYFKGNTELDDGLKPSEKN